jgi:cell division protein FtsW (lipid II flippase)
MFTQGQWIVAILFVVAFAVLMVYSYRKDRGLHKKHYKGSVWVLVGFILFVLFLFGIKFLMKS